MAGKAASSYNKTSNSQRDNDGALLALESPPKPDDGKKSQPKAKKTAAPKAPAAGLSNKQLGQVKEVFQQALLQFGGDPRANAARDHKGGPKGKGKGATEGPEKDKCRRCGGVHPECKTCPNAIADNDKEFDVGKASREGVKCYFRFHKLFRRLQLSIRLMLTK